MILSFTFFSFSCFVFLQVQSSWFDLLELMDGHLVFLLLNLYENLYVKFVHCCMRIRTLLYENLYTVV